jgi:3-phenylpropionate/trans-cinnamate dioxygenase ferredoxin reductase subunit
MARKIIIAGAGQAGHSLAAKLRALDAGCEITLIGAEPVPPYQRPPLSKKYLLGEMEVERLYLRPEAWYAENRIALRLGQPVEAIDRAARTVTVGGAVLPYDALALTTGSLPRRLPGPVGGELDGVHTVRTLADVDAMAAEFTPGRHLLVVGGGYIGLEAAAVAARRGLQVTLLEAAPRILQRVAAPETSAYFRAAHGAEGVEIREGVGLKRLLGEGRVSGAELSDGHVLTCDFVVVGVGIAPDTRLAEAAGLEIESGIAVDRQCRTSDPVIYAAGDCASFPGPAGRMRLESVGNAIDMAECAALNIAGQPTDYLPAPWFWSDQYDIKLQIAGLSTGYDRIVTRQTGEAVSHWYYAGDRLIAVDAMNDSRAYMIGKRLIEAGKSPDPALIADPEADLKPLLKA